MNFIRKHYINRQLKGFIKNGRRKQVRTHALKDANSICFFVRSDDANRIEELIEYAVANKEKKILILCYLPHKKDINIADTPPFLHVVSQKNVNMSGRINEQGLKDIFSQYYDIFIDMDTKTDLMSLYLKTLPKADFRIGGIQSEYKYFDFILCGDEQRTVKDYLYNLEVYTSKLKGN